MTEPLTIFGNEMRQSSLGTWVASVGLLHFRISKNDICCLAYINGAPVMNPDPEIPGVPIHFINERHAIGYLESEGSRISREMIGMAGEMVSVKELTAMVCNHAGNLDQITITETIPVRFKDK